VDLPAPGIPVRHIISRLFCLVSKSISFPIFVFGVYYVTCNLRCIIKTKSNQIYASNKYKI
jgi:hypothetical protein